MVFWQYIEALGLISFANIYIDMESIELFNSGIEIVVVLLQEVVKTAKLLSLKIFRNGFSVKFCADSTTPDEPLQNSRTRK